MDGSERRAEPGWRITPVRQKLAWPREPALAGDVTPQARGQGAIAPDRPLSPARAAGWRNVVDLAFALALALKKANSAASPAPSSWS